MVAITSLVGASKRAEPFFEKALELSPQDPWIQLDLAEFYMARAEQATSRKVRRSDLAQARRLFRAVIEMAPEIPEAHAKRLSSGVSIDQHAVLLELTHFMNRPEFFV